MIDALSAGTMLIEDGVQKPEAFVMETTAYAAGWSFIAQTTSSRLDRELESAGWTLFYMAGEIRTRSFGFNDGPRTERALARVVAAVKRERFNCLEVVAITRSSLFGLPYTKIVAHARHIQRSCRLQTASREVPASVRKSFPTYRNKPSREDESIQAWENEGGTPRRLDEKLPTLS